MKKPLTRSRRKATDKWLAYSGLATAFLATAADADAQVVYTDVDPDSVLVNEAFEIDFDGDGNVDVTIGHSTTSSGILIAGVNIPVTGGVLGVLSSSFLYPNVLANGVAIAPGDPAWQSQAFGSLFYATSSGGFGQWNGQTGFLGVRFQDSGGAMHYAWVELQVITGSTQVIVRGYAYETTAEVGINAGDMGSTTGIAAIAGTSLEMQLFPNPVVDHVDLIVPADLAGLLNVRVLNSAGQMVLAHQARADQSRRVSLDLQAIPAGAYVIEVKQGEQAVQGRFVKHGD